MTAARSLALAVTIMGVVALAVSAQGPTAAPTPDYRNAATIYSLLSPAQHGAAVLARNYVKAEKESEKKDIRQKMVDVLNEQFDNQMTEQQKELEELEKQITELRTVLKKRSAAKGTIVDQRVEQLIREADGMGWTAPGSPHGFPGPSFVPDNPFGRPITTPVPSTRAVK